MTHTIVRKCIDAAGVELAGTELVSTGDSEANADLSFSSGANHQVDFAAVRSKLKSLALYADKACTVYTNAASTGSPTDTIALAAGQAKVWTLAQDGLPACPFTADVTALYITTSTGTTVVKVRAVLDLTP